jgi:hypothetical protein
MKKDVINMQASVRGLLQNKAKETNKPFAEMLQYYGMERFLYRLGKSPYSRQFILKGALMFTVWNMPQRRTTLDIDFLARFDNQINSIEKAIKDICKAPVVSDGLVFDPETVRGQRIKEDADYEGVRVKFVGFLERSRIPMQIDIGFGDIVYPVPKVFDYPVILDFPKPHLKGYPPESVVSEKFEAMVKLGLLNSRMKDFYDIWLMMRKFEFDGLNITQALKRTFEHRKTELPQSRPLFAEDIYNDTSDRQKLWIAFLRKGYIKHAPDKLSATAKAIEKFLIKPLDAIHKGLTFKQTWNIAGKWQD